MLSDALIITRREIRDTLRDWRIMGPIAVLALVFPYVLQLASNFAIAYGTENGLGGIPLGFVPFALLVVGFFPMAISIVIALESFVGERERNSLEPLLASPISDTSLYVGKFLAALLPPLCGSLLALLAYSVTLYLGNQFSIGLGVLIQIALLTATEGVLMVAAGVVISAHTGSIRGANLLASFVVVPMGILVQVESFAYILGYEAVLWPLCAALAVVSILMLRMGVATFNRENLLSKEEEVSSWQAMLSRLRFHFIGSERFSLGRIYFSDLPATVRSNLMPLGVALVTAAGAVALGYYFGELFPLVPGAAGPNVVPDGLGLGLSPSNSSLAGQLDTSTIFLHNLRTLLIGSGLAVITFGSASLLVLAAPLALIGYFTASMAQVGIPPPLFLGVFILPHGIPEMLAALLASTFALRLGACITATPPGERTRERFIRALAEWAKVFVFVVLPLLLLAALIEANVTPRLATWLLGG